MELASKLFCDAVQQALDSPAIVLATIMERRHPFADQVKRRPDAMLPYLRMACAPAINLRLVLP